MRIFLLFITIFLYNFTYTQELSVGQNTQGQNAVNTTTSAKPKKEKKPYQYYPHTIGISTRLGGYGRFNIGANTANFLSTTTLDFYAGKRVGKTGYNSLIQFRLAGGNKDSLQAAFPFLDEFRWGLLLGGSQYIFDKRNSEFIGWSMLVNGGLSVDFPHIPRLKANPLASAVAAGIELDFKAIYNFEKFTAITFGMNLAYVISYTDHSTPVFDAENFPNPNFPKGLYIENAFVFGFSIGVLF
ncbi:MAG: hypothetical protein ACRCS8_05670 [Brevinema sp.]